MFTYTNHFDGRSGTPASITRNLKLLLAITVISLGSRPQQPTTSVRAASDSSVWMIEG